MRFKSSFTSGWRNSKGVLNCLSWVGPAPALSLSIAYMYFYTDVSQKPKKKINFYCCNKPWIFFLFYRHNKNKTNNRKKELFVEKVIHFPRFGILVSLIISPLFASLTNYRTKLNFLLPFWRSLMRTWLSISSNHAASAPRHAILGFRAYPKISNSCF